MFRNTPHSLRTWLSGLMMATAPLLTLGSAHAQLTLPINTLTADSVQQFTELAKDSFDTLGVQVTAKGNTVESNGAYRMPITSITLGKSKYVGTPDATIRGSSTGSALEIARVDRGTRRSVTLANFTVDYHQKKVLADVTVRGQSTVPQMAIYDFSVKRPLDLDVNTQGLIELNERLVNLRLTPAMIQTLTSALNLPSFAGAIMRDTDYGTLQQTIVVKWRAATPMTPYVPQ